jgi:hypothetical protein
MFSRGDPAGHPHPSTPVRRTRGSESHGMRSGQSGYAMRCLSPVTHVCAARSLAPHPTQLQGYLINGVSLLETELSNGQTHHVLVINFQAPL